MANLNSLDYEKEIDEIRERLYNESLELGLDEFMRRQNDKVEKAAQQYGFEIIPANVYRYASNA
ncbi:MAG: hypothetical protein LBS74_01810 [Oscillospiraceae bacterium]|jgi:hypothetical protein|nr:hypothetical protein [Oscillospiraceae bacterium]